MSNVSYQYILQQAKSRLSTVSNESVCLDVEVLLAHAANFSRAQLWTHAEQPIKPTVLQLFERLLQRRMNGEPVAYILGEKEFWSMMLRVTPDTLIPRPETECLVEEVLKCADHTTIRVLDLGTGTGAIALALSRERPAWQITAVDISAAALEIAKYNAQKHAISNIIFLQSDWFSVIDTTSQFHIILSNPPYIRNNDPLMAQGDVRFEPKQALLAGEQGLDAYQQIITQSKFFLLPQGYLLLEHGYNQASVIQSLLQQSDFCNIQTTTDYAGIERITKAQMLA